MVHIGNYCYTNLDTKQNWKKNIVINTLTITYKQNKISSKQAILISFVLLLIDHLVEYLSHAHQSFHDIQYGKIQFASFYTKNNSIKYKK